MIEGSGKSHTMYGNSRSAGIIPRSFNYLLEEINKRIEYKFELKMSCFQIYNESFNDLLCIDNKAVAIKTVDNVEKLVNLEKADIETEHDFHAALEMASKNRKTAATDRNKESSRSHAAICWANLTHIVLNRT